MTKPKPKEQLLPLMSVQIRGIVYNSVKDVCTTFSVTESNVRALLSRGKIDRVGLGYKGYRRGNNPPPKEPKPILMFGREFPSLKDLSSYLGRNRGYASSVLSKYPDGMKRLREEYLRVAMTELAHLEMARRKDIESAMLPEDRKRRY
jgi:hypothetical protein